MRVKRGGGAETHFESLLHLTPAKDPQISTFTRARTVTLGRCDLCEFLSELSVGQGREMVSVRLDYLSSFGNGSSHFVLLSSASC